MARRKRRWTFRYAGGLAKYYSRVANNGIAVSFDASIAAKTDPMKEFSIAVLAVLMTAAAAGVRAEVVDSAANGFSVRHTVVVERPRAYVYQMAVENVGEWWSDDHTFSGNAHRMFIDPRPLGCFCETLGDDAGVVHLVVTFVNPGVMLRLSGGLGPLGLMGVDGNMTWEFSDHEAGTTVTLHYAVGGYAAGGLDALAPAVDSVLAESLDRLKAYAESGDQER